MMKGRKTFYGDHTVTITSASEVSKSALHLSDLGVTLTGRLLSLFYEQIIGRAHPYEHSHFSSL